MVGYIIKIFRSKRSARILLICGTILFLILFLIVELLMAHSDIDLFPYRLAYLILFIVGALTIIHSVPSVFQSNYYKFFKQPFVYWLFFVIISTWFIFRFQKDLGHAFVGFQETYRSHFTFFQALSYVINLVTFSDPGDIVPITAISKFVVMVIKVSQLVFLVWFIGFVIALRTDYTFKGTIKKGDFGRCQNYMQDILRKSGFVNQFFVKLEADIAQSQANISELEKKRKKLENLRSIEQEEVDALMNSLGKVVKKELKKTTTLNFISNLTAGATVALVGYLLGKVIETLFR